MLSLARTRIETDRVILRPPVMADAARLVELANHFEIARYLATMPYPYSRQDAEQFIAHCEADPAVFAFTIWPKQHQVIVGMCGYGPARDNALHIDFGYWLGLDYRGKGYAREAAAAVLVHAFCVSRIEVLETNCRLDNPRSKQLLDVLGFATVGQSERVLRGEGKAMACHDLRLTAGDWLQTKACA